MRQSAQESILVSNDAKTHTNMNKLVRFAVLSVAAAVMAVSAHAEPNQKTQTIFKNLLTAVVANDYNAFVAECDDNMKAVITRATLSNVSDQIAPRAKKGYDALYFGEMIKEGHHIHLWRLRFKDGGDDVLATLSIKDDVARGFYLK